MHNVRRHSVHVEVRGWLLQGSGRGLEDVGHPLPGGLGPILLPLFQGGRGGGRAGGGIGSGGAQARWQGGCWDEGREVGRGR